MRHDVIVIGGGYAGMAAALQLLRARRQVLVIDAGQRRNRFARTSHGFLGQDGAAPDAIAATARQQLARYATLSWVDGQVTQAGGVNDAFSVSMGDGVVHEGRRLLFATGVADLLPDVAGLQERWGVSVFHCPYCHGFELERGRIGCIATGAMSAHQAMLLTEWGDVTLFTNGVLEPDAGALAELNRRGVAIETTRVSAITRQATVQLADGRTADFAGLFVAPRNLPASPLAEQLGCALEDTPLGRQIRTDATRETSVPGAFACGDVARAPHSVSLAVGDGAWAGGQVHRSLVFDHAA
ncbi:thioredoxin reductase [Camelimonas fluminis]|uniref:Thioredoxin reductase n=1 Tax=Camelimonas fluminis TaxID=1576911 RepID=A0ABV7UJ53_9HYPH|nr:NAD(P)/FAD-dependent oxidoreductase [Camelimonas fluminis]GHE59815.1 thioredoxin reductase [Camelimonas fluminis]